MENKIKTAYGILVFIALLLSLNMVMAVGYSIPYDTDTPLNVYPGEEKTIEITLAPYQGEKDTTVRVTMLEDGGIASLPGGDEYQVLNSEPVVVKVDLKVPKDAVVGNKYNLEFKTEDITPSEREGMVSFTISNSFGLIANVIEKPVTPVSAPVSETPQEEGIGTGWIILGIIVIIALIIIIYFIIKSRRK